MDISSSVSILQFSSFVYHILTSPKVAEAEKAGLAKVGIEADIYQIAETLPQEVLTKVIGVLPCQTTNAKSTLDARTT
jgi:hypothetical protein